MENIPPNEKAAAVLYGRKPHRAINNSLLPVWSFGLSRLGNPNFKWPPAEGTIFPHRTSSCSSFEFDRLSPRVPNKLLKDLLQAWWVIIWPPDRGVRQQRDACSGSACGGLLNVLLCPDSSRSPGRSLLSEDTVMQSFAFGGGQQHSAQTGKHVLSFITLPKAGYDKSPLPTQPCNIVNLI